MAISVCDGKGTPSWGLLVPKHLAVKRGGIQGQGLRDHPGVATSQITDSRGPFSPRFSGLLK